MKAYNTRKLVVLAGVAYAVMVTGCSIVPGAGSGNGSATVSGINNGNNNNNGGGGGSSNSISTTVPTVDVIPARIANALTLPATTASPSPSPLVNPVTSKNFSTVLAQQGPNLAITTDPASATGAGAVSLLAFAACNDVTPGAYGVTGTLTSGVASAAQSSQIVAAGLTIVNQCTAGLAASGSSLNTSVSQYFSDLVAADSGTAPADASSYNPPLVAASPAGTPSQSFISVCTAAVSFCVGMMSF